MLVYPKQLGEVRANSMSSHFSVWHLSFCSQSTAVAKNICGTSYTGVKVAGYSSCVQPSLSPMVEFTVGYISMICWFVLGCCFGGGFFLHPTFGHVLS